LRPPHTCGTSIPVRVGWITIRPLKAGAGLGGHTHTPFLLQPLHFRHVQIFKLTRRCLADQWVAAVHPVATIPTASAGTLAGYAAAACATTLPLSEQTFQRIHVREDEGTL